MYKFSRLFTKTEYTVAYRFSDKGLLNDMKTSFKSIKTGDDRWYADPFIVKNNGNYYVFMEVFMKDRGYAGIGYSTIINDELTEPEIIIDTGYHMSFPVVYYYKEKYYMIPETCSQNKIQIFECTDFPRKWQPVYTIAEGKPYYDSVLFEMHGEPYMFSSTATDDMYGSTLFLMKLEQDGMFWKVKEEKKISTDYTVSREAGKMLYSENNIYRVAQDCSNNDYGHAVNFIKIDNMDYDNYYEHLVKTIKASDIRTEHHIKGIAGIHTYDREDNFEVIDFKLCTFSVKSTFLKFKIVIDMMLKKCGIKRE